MSDFSKFLCPITVGEDGWLFTTSRGSTTLPTTTHSTVLHTAGVLNGRLTALASGTWKAYVTSTGIFSLSCSLSWTWSAASTDADLKTALGLDGTETVSGYTLTANKRHDWGWYPGVTTHNDGEGIAYDTKWIAEDVDNIGIAGTGAMRRVGPSRSPYKRTIRFEILHYDEVFGDRGKAPCDFLDRWRNLRSFRFYPDRSKGTVLSTGVQIDPGHPNYELDGDHDYYTCNLERDGIVITANDTNPDYYSVQMQMTCEKKTS